MRTSTYVYCLGGALALFGAAGAARHLPPYASQVDAPSHASSPIPFREQTARRTLDFPAGARYVYAVAWTTDTAVQIASQGNATQNVAAKAAFMFDLVLSSFGRTGSTYTLAAEIRNVARHDFTIAGGRAFGDDAEVRRMLEGHVAYIDVLENGRVTALRFPQKTPRELVHVLTAATTQMQLTLQEGVSWEATETTALGKSLDVYEVDAASPLAFRRTRRGYAQLDALPGGIAPGDVQKVAAAAAIAIDPRGHLASLEEDEAVSIRSREGAQKLESRTHFAIKLTELSTFEGQAPVLANLETLRPGEPLGPEEMARQILVQEVGGLTPAELAANIASYARDGSVVEAKAWFSRSAALLKQNPDLCYAIASMFEAKTMSPRGRQLIVELLVAAGHGVAQSTLRDLLESPAALSDARGYARMLQGASLLVHPERQTVDAVAETARAAHARGDTASELTALNAVGALAGKLRRDGAEDAARAYATSLSRDLAASEGAERKSALLFALGNTGLASTLPAIEHMREDPDADVRRSVAVALGHMDTSESHAVLFDMLFDDAASVSAEALGALRGMPLAPADVARVVDAAFEGRLSPSLDDALVSFLADHLASGERTTAVLEQLRARAADNMQKARIVALLRASKSTG